MRTKGVGWLELTLILTVSPPTPSNHPNFSASYMSVSIDYEHIKQFHLSLQYFERSLQIKLLSLFPNHSDLVDRYANIAAVYKRQENLVEDLSFSEKALGIFAQNLSPTHSKIINTQNCI